MSLNFNVDIDIAKQLPNQVSDKMFIKINDEDRKNFRTKIDYGTRKMIFDAFGRKMNNAANREKVCTFYETHFLSIRDIVLIHELSRKHIIAINTESVLYSEEFNKKEIVPVGQDVLKKVIEETEKSVRSEFHITPTLCNLTSDNFNNYVTHTDDVSPNQFVEINVDEIAKVDFYFQRGTPEFTKANSPSSTPPLTAKKRSSNELSAFEDQLEPNAKRPRTTDDNATTQYPPHEGMQPYNNSQISSYFIPQPAIINTSEINNSTSLYFDPSIELENEFVDGNDEGSIASSSTTTEKAPNEDDDLFSFPLPENPIFDVPTLEEFFGMPPWEPTQRTESSSPQSVTPSVSPEIKPKNGDI